MNDWAVIGTYASSLYGLVRDLLLGLKLVHANLLQPGGLVTDLWRDMESAKREALDRRRKKSFPVRQAEGCGGGRTCA